MKTVLSICLFLLFIGNISGQVTKKVLFLGNSYTAVNNLPAIVANIAHNMGDSLAHSENTPGGFTLQGHSTDATSLSYINQGGWDYVVLQEQSQKPSWPISQVISSVFPYAKTLSSLIVQSSPCAKPLFFMTWGRKNGDSYNCANWPPVCTYNGMDSLLNLRYRMMADSNDAYVSPVGAVWHYIRDTKPGINLYASDESHPSAAGSYAAACTFYTLIFQKDPSLITFDFGLDPIMASDIRFATKIIAYDSLAKWNVGKYLPNAQFSENHNMDTVYFENQSDYAIDYTWKFGDGNTSKLFEPTHIYTVSGNYKVILEANKCGNTDTISHIVQVTISALNIPDYKVYKIYPNPIENQITIAFNKSESLQNIVILSIDGKLIKNYENSAGKQIQLDVSQLTNGIYILQFTIEGMKYQYKIVKH
jgi:hypothetical protein